jgi:hypothetical protein
MITSVVGHTFLNAYNEKNGTSLTPKEFFVKEYFEVFYNHTKYMQWVTNSPFVQMKGGQKVHLLKPTERIEKLDALHLKISEGTSDGSFALGFPASESKEFASTSGMVSDLEIPVDEDEVYLSWIGSGLGIGVAGGYTILFDDAEITLQTYEGWKVYRSFLNQQALTKLRGNQIGTWNGQWLSYYFGKDFDPDFDFGMLENKGVFGVSASAVEVKTVNWTKLYFSLSQLYPSATLLAYLYGFGQTNKTIGFIPFQLSSASRLKTIHQSLVGDDVSISWIDFDALFGMHIKRACELGSIGLQALRPEGLVKYMKGSKKIAFKKEEDKINYFIYKTWLLAMVSRNKEETKDYTLEVARTILKYRTSGTKNDRKNLVEKDLFEAKSKRGFIKHLTVMISGVDDDQLEVLKGLKDEIHLMNNEEFGYFAVLLRFDYTYLEKQS